MKVEFQHYSKDAAAPHIPVTFTRDVPMVPRVGDHIVQHTGKRGSSTTFEVKQVTHVFEDRPEYQGKDYGGDGIIVTMQTIPEEFVQDQFQTLVDAAKGLGPGGGTYVKGSLSIDAILKQFGVDPEEVSDTIRASRRDEASRVRENERMPKVDEARRIQQFRVDDKFQENFDAWAAKIEKDENGTLVITHEEVLLQGTTLLIFYRIEPKPHVVRGRRF